VEKSLSSPRQLAWLSILRILIGWHFLYEGITKIFDPDWSAYGYLMTSDGFLSGLFKAMAGNPGVLDAVSSATTQYFAEKGLLFDIRDGRVIDVTHLHMKEWLHCIRTGEKPSCSIKEGFEEAIASLMATLAFRKGRRVEYDYENERIVVPGMEGADLDQVLIS